MQAGLRILTPLAILGAFLLSGCAGIGADGRTDVGDRPPYDPGLTAADFVSAIDNPFLPMPVGARWTYEVDEERIEVVVLEETRAIQGVAATVVRDTVTEDGEVVEDTFDWYAQDKDGNVWYLGEDTKEYEGGEVVSTEGSWEWGKDGALPGIVMWADPQPNRTAYYQEFYWEHAIDQAAVYDEGASVAVEAGTFTDTVTTREWNALHGGSASKDYEVVHYARGIGPVQKGSPDGDMEELVSYEMPTT